MRTLDSTIELLKLSQRELADTQEALSEIEEIRDYGHYTLDLTLGGSTTGPSGNGYQKMKVVLDFLHTGGDAKKSQAKLFECLRQYLSAQLARYQKDIVRCRKRIKELA